MPQTPRRLLISALRQACLVAPLLIGLSQSANAYTWKAVDLNKDISTTEAWYNVETNTTWMSPLTKWDPMTFVDAKSTVSGLDYFGTTGWRLPILGDKHASELWTKGELGQLYASFGSLSELSKTFLPSGTQANSLYGSSIWYGDSAGDTNYFLNFNYFNGSVSTGSDNGTQFQAFAWVVHDGDLRITTSVPEPHESTMLLAGVLALGFMARRRRAADKTK